MTPLRILRPPVTARLLRGRPVIETSGKTTFRVPPGAGEGAEIKATAGERGEVEGEIKALRLRQRAEGLASAEADRIALAGAARPASAEGRATRGSKPAVDRATARSRHTDLLTDQAPLFSRSRGKSARCPLSKAAWRNPPSPPARHTGTVPLEQSTARSAGRPRGNDRVPASYFWQSNRSCWRRGSNPVRRSSIDAGNLLQQPEPPQSA